MITKQDKNATRKKRHYRLRRDLTGTAERPRLNVYRSNKHIYAQLIEDTAGKTLASAYTVEPELKLDATGNVEAAQKVGELLAKRATDANLKSVVFDRGGYLYHGRVKALADAARENGLEF